MSSNPRLVSQSFPSSFSWGMFSDYPALSVGLPIFTFVLYVIDSNVNFALADKFSLYPGAILAFDLNRLSFYLLFHKDFAHWFFNTISIVTPLGIFERTHGTIYTGVLLNLLAVVTGIQYSIIGSVLYEGHVIGLSGVVYSLMAYTAYKEHFTTPILYSFKVSGRDIQIPTLYAPFLVLIVWSFILGGSFIGHLCGISTGYLLGMGYMKFLFPPSKVILFIERHSEKAIKLLDGIVIFYRESDAVSQRGVSYSPLFSSDPEAGA